MRAIGDGKPLVFETVTERIVSNGTAGARAALSGRMTLEDGRFAVPSFQLLAEKYLDPKDTRPEAVAAETGVAADTIRGLAAEIARVAFDEAIFIDQPWTDMNGERHDGFVGRPVSFHAMRGLSAHSNGFQTARALHMLQVLIGAVDCPGGFRFEPPYPKPVEAHPTPHGKAEHFGSNKPLSGPHLGFPRGPEDLLIDAAGKPMRIDKAFSWDAPISAHGLMHMVIANAHAGDPYPIDVLFLYMANMAWNSSMNTAGVIRMLEDKDDATGEYRIPKIIYSDAYASEMVAYADLVLPDTTYLERHDCISMLDRPISEPDAVQDAIRWPVLEPDRDVRGFQSVLHRSRRAAEAAGLRRSSGQGALQGLRGLYRASRAAARHRAAGRLSRAGGDRTGRGAANPRPAEALYRERLVLLCPYPARGAVLQARQQGLSGLCRAHGLLRYAAAGDVPALSGDAAEIPAVGGRPARAVRARDAPAAHPGRASIRCRSGIGRSRKQRSTAQTFPIMRSPSGRRRCIIPGVR